MFLWCLCEQEIFRTVATTMPMPGAVEGFWGAFLEQFNFSMDFGNLNEFIQAMKPPAGVECDRLFAARPRPCSDADSSVFLVSRAGLPTLRSRCSSRCR